MTDFEALLLIIYKRDPKVIFNGLAGILISRILIELLKRGNHMDLIHKDLGQYAKADLVLKEGSLVASISVPVIALMDELAAKVKAAIPGQVDDAIIDLVMAAAKAELLK